RLSARFRLLAPDSSRSQVQEVSETSQAAGAHRFLSAYRLSLWRRSEFQLWIRTWVLLRRALNRSLSELTWPSSPSLFNADEVRTNYSTRCFGDWFVAGDIGLVEKRDIAVVGFS